MPSPFEPDALIVHVTWVTLCEYVLLTYITRVNIYGKRMTDVFTFWRREQSPPLRSSNLRLPRGTMHVIDLKMARRDTLLIQEKAYKKYKCNTI